jgi:hypothetical protein
MADGGEAGVRSRRALLAQAGVAGTIVWSAPVVSSFFTPSAAASGTVQNAAFYKDITGVACTAVTRQSNATRGLLTITKRQSAGMVDYTITIDSGPNPVGGAVTLYQYNPLTGVCTTTNRTMATNPETFTIPLLAGATTFVAELSIGGGGGTDRYANDPPIVIP